MPTYLLGTPTMSGLTWWSTTNTTSATTSTYYPLGTASSGSWYQNTPTTSSQQQYLLPLYMTPSSDQYAAYMQQRLAVLQQEQAMRAQQQNRYQPMGLYGLHSPQPQPQPQPLAAPAILRRPRRSDEVQAAYEARRAEQVRQINETQARATEYAQRRVQADQRALALLHEHLSEAQLATLAVEGWFIVHAQSGKRYRIRANGGVAGNIDELHASNDNRVVSRLCCHMENALPSADHFLAQKIMLESAEADFLRIANRHAVA